MIIRGDIDLGINIKTKIDIFIILQKNTNSISKLKLISDTTKKANLKLQLKHSVIITAKN